MNDLFANLGDRGTRIFKFMSAVILIGAFLNYNYHYFPSNYIFIGMFGLYGVLWLWNVIRPEK
ncbi:MAG: hypothetical protein ACKVLJ_09395 [Cytophagales bacterium]|jgi:hypothetical protein|nr:hypothetical protein [Cyclobacteriaceae bacterium]MDA8889779.1 hypothetical protein [Cyclobacteriaceae bacterium]|tara:strand:- start:203 stop:391 length:189 start_codon:yes stop_codon:yes gene_type:complete